MLCYSDPGKRGDFMVKQSKEIEASGHLYTVEIRFFGDHLDPQGISRQLNLRASTVGPLGSKKIPVWAYNGEGEIGFHAEWASLEPGLEFLIQLLLPARPAILELSKNHKGCWWCGHFQSSFDGGPELSPKILADLASFGLPLSIDNYFSNED